jgi:hypothetical protein
MDSSTTTIASTVVAMGAATTSVPRPSDAPNVERCPARRAHKLTRRSPASHCVLRTSHTSFRYTSADSRAGRQASDRLALGPPSLVDQCQPGREDSFDVQRTDASAAGAECSMMPACDDSAASSLTLSRSFRCCCASLRQDSGCGATVGRRGKSAGLRPVSCLTENWGGHSR